MTDQITIAAAATILIGVFTLLVPFRNPKMKRLQLAFFIFVASGLSFATFMWVAAAGDADLKEKAALVLRGWEALTVTAVVALLAAIFGVRRKPHGKKFSWIDDRRR